MANFSLFVEGTHFDSMRFRPVFSLFIYETVFSLFLDLFLCEIMIRQVRTLILLRTFITILERISTLCVTQMKVFMQV